MSKNAADFLVGRVDLRQHKLVTGPAPEIEPGEVLLKVDKFAFTSNNVTYAAFGDAMKYWEFFPAPEGFGKVPVWGFADVVASKAEGIAVGERVFGYFPMSTHLVVRPSHVKPTGFVDASPHRAELALVYNQYNRVAGDPGYVAAYEDQQALLRPLYMTAFFIDDLLADNNFFGAKAVILSSASSKTALGVAYLLSQNRDVEVIGLTSKGNIPFVESTGYYDRIVAYDDIASLPSDLAVAFVDMAGNAKVIADLHNHFRDAMTYSCVVGGTHWEARGVGKTLPGPKPVFFFAPTQIAKRTKDWGPGGIEKRFAESWKAFLGSVASWMHVVRGSGAKNVEQVYLDMLDGKVKPDEGHILSL
ncbi:MAG: DUF2855 family protein [Parvibaculum sp.]|uniref:DUF2855 family protein n=1 Tax=Parvibaculum sp. TaxID=2024848 RepID=UPI0025E96743|nr:DUF2855 family protein [Parvibaculum sp.]MCE9648527.1 DUF2855 family protein [Parvibaculum sp.]